MGTMPGLPFTLRQLEIFEHLCDSRSFRSTSEHLGISQAAVSNQIKVLEDQIGVRLLTRASGKRPQLTPEGEAFLADLAPFHDAAKALAWHRRKGPVEKKEPPRPLRLLISLQLLDSFVRPALGEFLRDHPDVQLVIETEAAFGGPRQALSRGNYDIGLFSERADNPVDDRFKAMSRVICGVFGHEAFLKGHDAPLSAKDIEALPFILPPTGSFHESEVLLMLAQQGISPQNILGRTQYFDVMVVMCETGAAVAVTLQSLVKPELRNTVRLLRRLGDWRLTLYNKPNPSPQQTAVTDFLLTSVLENPAYPEFRTD